jgi:hypothetical protein
MRPDDRLDGLLEIDGGVIEFHRRIDARHAL